MPQSIVLVNHVQWGLNKKVKITLKRYYVLKIILKRYSYSALKNAAMGWFKAFKVIQQNKKSKN